MHKGFDIPQLRASEEWYVFIGHEYMYLKWVALATSGKISIKDTLQFIQCFAGFMRCKSHIKTTETLKRLSIS